MTNNNIPQIEEEFKEFLRRCVERNKSGYNPKDDIYFVSDCIRSIEFNIKPIILNKNQIQILKRYFNNETNIKKARKKIDKISNKLENIFFPKHY